MDFTFDEDQLAIRDLLRGVLRERVSLERVRALAEGTAPPDAETWSVLASEVGVLGLCLPEKYGGQSFGLVELALVLEESGWALYPGPLASTLVSLRALARADAGPALERILDAGLAVTRATGPAAAAPRLEGTALTGSLPYVVDAGQCSLLLAWARRDPDDDARVLVGIDPSAPGVEREELPGLDPTRTVWSVRLTGVPVEVYDTDASGNARTTHAEAKLALAAEMVGVAQRCLDLTVEHVTTRRQFGRAIGSFQAVKHQCADMLIELELARTAVYLAACRADRDAGDLKTAAAAAFLQAARAGVLIGGATIQLHGGLGFTWEHPAHLLVKRLHAGARSFGGVAEQSRILWRAAA